MGNHDNDFNKELSNKADPVIIQHINKKYDQLQNSLTQKQSEAIDDLQKSASIAYQDMLKQQKQKSDQLLAEQDGQRNGLLNQFSTAPVEQPMIIDPPQLQKRGRGKRGKYLKRRSEALEKTLINIYAYKQSGKGFFKRGRGGGYLNRRVVFNVLIRGGFMYNF